MVKKKGVGKMSMGKEGVRGIKSLHIFLRAKK